MNTRNGWYLLVVLAVLGLVASVASAGTYYVDLDWTGTESGTQTEPYKTIKAGVAAADASAAPRRVYIAAGTYADVANSGTEDYSAGGGSDHGIVISTVMTVAGGYAGWQGGASFDWSEGSRTPRATIIDLHGADSRAFRAEWPGGNGPSSGPTFDGLTFRNADVTGDGGALYGSAHNYWILSVTNCLFTNNAAASSGGAVRMDSRYVSASVKNSDFVDNRATNDAGAVAFYSAVGGNGTVVENSTFLRNTAGSQGGAIIWTATGSPAQYVRRCRFEANTAGTRGGALFANDPYLQIERCTFVGNSAPSGAAVGGASYWCGPSSLQNCLVYGNSGGYAVQADGARMYKTYTLDVVHCTVVSNSGGGLRARFNDGTQNKPMRVRNSIVADNGGYGIYRQEDDYIFANNNVYSNALGNYYNCSADAASISTNAAFVDPAAGDYRLSLGSPSVDAGTNDTGLAIDLDGTYRPTRNGWDQGCYEESGACRIVHQAPVITASNVTLRGQLVYDGGSNDAEVVVYWGAADGGTTNGNWDNPEVIGYVTNGGNFDVTIEPPNGTSWFRCYATNWYDGVWADASETFEFAGGAAVAIWTGGSSNALASNPDNWFSGAVPQPQDTVKFDSDQANCTWDAAAPASVSKWEQTAAYGATVTVARAWGSGLTVSNDMLILGGRLTHAANSTGETYRLLFNVGGNLEWRAARRSTWTARGMPRARGRARVLPTTSAARTAAKGT